VIEMRAPRFIHQHKFDLFADALLITSGLFALVCSIALTLVWLFGGFANQSGELGPDSTVDAMVGALTSLAVIGGVLGGPAWAWHLHGRRLQWKLLLAVPAAAAAFFAIALGAPVLSMLFDIPLSLVSDSENRGGAALLVLVSIGYLTVLVHAMRDAMAPAGDPPMLERLRLLSFTALLLLVFVTAGAMALGYGAEIGEALIFTMLVGIIAGATTVAATYIDPHPGLPAPRE
jgi:hypothetical protein